MVPKALSWIRTDGQRLEASLRRRVIARHRPPRFLPCWFHNLWFHLVSRLFRTSVIIGLEGDSTELMATMQRHRLKPRRHLNHLDFVCARPTMGALRDISSCPGVLRIWEDREVHTLLDAAVPSAGVGEAARRYTGKGVTIAVVDTGIYPHPDLAGRIAAFKDLVGGRTSPYDDNGHGTHVAGCAAGDGGSSGGLYRGSAPGVSLVGVKVLNKRGSGVLSTLLAGIDWVIQNKDRHQIRVMSMSLGAPAESACGDDPLCQAVGLAWAAGIVTVVAAGNEGPEPGTVSTPGINSRVITVGAMDDRGTPDRSDDQLAPFSSRGPAPDGQNKPDLLAPGVGITSLRAPGSYLDKHSQGTPVGQWYLTLSGTSMATPVISGICALILEASPEMTPDQVKERLMTTAQDWGLTPDEQGAGYVDGDRAVLQP